MRSALAYLGRHATLFMAGGVLIGLVAPPLATLAKPLLVPTLLIPLSLALVRLDWSAIAGWRHRSTTALLLVVWMLGVSPLLVWAMTTALVPLGFPEPLRQAVVLMAAASPIVSAVAIALILRLDPAIAIVIVLPCTALVPFTLPPLGATLLDVHLDISVGAFMLRLALLVGVSFAGAWILRRIVTPQTLDRHHELLDGLTVVNMIVFGIGIMDGVTAYAFERPGYVLATVAAGYAFNLLLQVGGYVACYRLGRREALTVALASGNRNMGLVLVALAGQAPFEVTMFFALAQIPMYTLPALLRPVYVRALSAPDGRRMRPG